MKKLSVPLCAAVTGAFCDCIAECYMLFCHGYFHLSCTLYFVGSFLGDNTAFSETHLGIADCVALGGTGVPQIQSPQLE